MDFLEFIWSNVVKKMIIISLNLNNYHKLQLEFIYFHVFET